MEEKKTSILATLEILQNDSDAEHILSQNDMITLLSERYGLNLDRRTLYSNINMLIDFGYDISVYSENKKGYFLQERQFEESEVLLLCNAIHASNYVPDNASKRLINKLLKTQSRYSIQNFRNTVYISNLNKKDNSQFFLNIEVIAQAIQEEKVISFHYTQYNLKKKVVLKRTEPYLVSPYSMVSADGKTYLIAKSIHHDGLTHFRIDKIKDVDIIDGIPYKKPLKKEDPYVYSKNKVYMYGGEMVNAVMKCDLEILDDLIDRFGKDIPVVPADSAHFITRIKASRQGLKFFALQYLDHMEILEPADFRNELKDTLKKGASKYR